MSSSIDSNAVARRLLAIRDAQARGRAFDFELMLEQHYRRFLRPADEVIDAGAHTGRHLMQFIQCVGSTGRVVAFEPLPFAFAHLAKHYGLPNVSIRKTALSDVEGMVSFVHARGTPEESGLRERVYNAPAEARPEKIEVEAETLDRHSDEFTRLRYVKIDVEGGEMNVLNGGVRLLQRHRPFVSVEYGCPGYSAYGHTLFTLFDFAQVNDFVMYDIFANRLDRECWPLSCDAICWDFFMVPIEKEMEFAHLVPPVVVD